MTMYKKIKELPENQKTTTVVLLALIEEKETRAGKPYCELTLSDGETQIQAKLWNNAKADVKVEEKSLITAELYPKEYQGALSYELFRYGPAPEDCQITDYVIKAPYKPEDMYQEILNLLRKEIAVPDPEKLDLIDLVKNIYEENKENLLYWSAAKSVHHNCYSGLLYHTFRMVRSAVMLSRVYPVDRELLLAGTALHDIGKLSELETDNLGVADYSVDGNLFGHSLIGCEMVTKAACLYLDGTDDMQEFYNDGEEKEILFQPSICGLSIEEVRAYIKEYIDRSSSDRILYTLPFSDDCIIQTRKDMENEKIFNQVIKPVEYENSPYTDLVKQIRDFLVCSGFEGEDEYVK